MPCTSACHQVTCHTEGASGRRHTNGSRMPHAALMSQLACENFYVHCVIAESEKRCSACVQLQSTGPSLDPVKSADKFAPFAAKNATP